MQPSVAQVIFTLFWGSHVPTLEYCQERGRTVNSGNYSEMLWNQWRPAVWKKCWGMVVQDVAPLHDIAHPQCWQKCWSTFQMWSIQIIACLPYFTIDQQEKEAVHAWLVRRPKAQKLAWYTKCIENKSDSVGKWCYVQTQKKCYVVFKQYIPDILWLILIPPWSKSTVNAAADCDPTERQGSSIWDAARETLVTVCDKFQLVRCSQSVVSCGWEKVCFKVCHKSWITNNALTWNFVSNCKKVLQKHTKC